MKLTEVAPGLYYCQKTGKPYSTRQGKFPYFHKVPKELKAKNNDGYILVSINGKTERWNRVIYRHFHGEIPQHLVIDHRDGTKELNLLSNLQAITQQKNVWKSSPYSNNTSGLKGVSWNKSKEKWCAGIRLNGKRKNLGLFNDKVEAYMCYREAKKLYHGIVLDIVYPDDTIRA